MDKVTPEFIASLAGVILSILFSYVPGLKDKFEPLAPATKRLVMLALLFVAAAGALAFSCKVVPECYTQNWVTYVSALVAAVVANQGTFLITKPSGG